MKDTHGEHEEQMIALATGSLNPYCNERYSWRSAVYTDKLLCTSLNPYCNERYSWRNLASAVYNDKLLCLNPYCNERYSWRVKTHISLKTK